MDTEVIILVVACVAAALAAVAAGFGIAAWRKASSGDLEWTLRRELKSQREEVDAKLSHGSAGVTASVDRMRDAVDAKLARLERGIGEMQTLASGVGDLTRLLSNVKARGTWGEYQLGAILEQVLAPGQYVANAHVSRKREVVEYAIRLPGRDSSSGGGEPVLLPIDSKFPREDYDRLVDASASGDSAAAEAASKRLAQSFKSFARDIFEKYVCPPATTDFAVMFLPSEGLYAEAARQPGLLAELQTKYRVVPAGPSTLAALINSLHVGFQTLAIERGSHEVLKMLAGLRKDFDDFDAKLALIGRHLASASNVLEEAGAKSNTIKKRLEKAGQGADGHISKEGECDGTGQ